MSNCTVTEVALASDQPLTLEVMRLGTNIYVYAGNQGKNICVIKRVRVCREWSNGGTTVNYLRASDFVFGEKVEQGWTGMLFKLSASGAVAARAVAEYFEITGRSQSCETSL